MWLTQPGSEDRSRTVCGESEDCAAVKIGHEKNSRRIEGEAGRSIQSGSEICPRSVRCESENRVSEELSIEEISSVVENKTGRTV